MVGVPMRLIVENPMVCGSVHPGVEDVDICPNCREVVAEDEAEWSDRFKAFFHDRVCLASYTQEMADHACEDR
jgi:hypothetical protein